MRLSFSSDLFAPPARREAIEAAFGAHVRGALDFQPDAPPHAALRMVAVGEVHVARIETSPLRLVTPSADDDLFYLSLNVRGGGVLDATGRARTVTEGEANVMRRDRRCTTLVALPSRILSLALPRALLERRFDSARRLDAATVRSGPALQLLERYADTLLDSAEDLAPDDQATLAGHLADLTSMALGARRDPAGGGRAGVRAARRQAIKADIAAHLDAPQLSVTWIAKRNGVSGAYLRALFYDEGISFTDYVLDQRLTQVHALLCAPHLADRNIATLALAAGFSDISWFNLAFRRRFGMTPSDCRNQARAAAE